MKKILFYTNQFFGQIGGENLLIRNLLLKKDHVETPTRSHRNSRAAKSLRPSSAETTTS